MMDEDEAQSHKYQVSDTLREVDLPAGITVILVAYRAHDPEHAVDEMDSNDVYDQDR